jgi:hypothetical protein
MPARKRDSGLYYVTRAGTEVDLSKTAPRLLGVLEMRLLQAHLLHAMEQVGVARRVAADGPAHAGHTEQPLPLTGDPSIEGRHEAEEV